MILSTYRKEILGAVFGALLTAVVSLSVGLYSLNKSFELTQKKDLLYSLRSDITLLRNAERELDENLNLLLNHEYHMTFRAERLPMPKFPMETKEDEESVKKIMEYLEQLRGSLFKVAVMRVPQDRFVADAWEPSGPPVSNIDFELIQRLNDFYRKLLRASDFIKRLSVISKDMVLSQGEVNRINSLLPQYGNLINDMTQKKILDLKNEIVREVDRLQKERSKIRM